MNQQPQHTYSATIPHKRADCISGPRPCPHISCRYHLAGDSVTHTCALDLADDGGMTLDEVGQVLGVSRERVRQIEMQALNKLRRFFPSIEHVFGEDAHAYDPNNLPIQWGAGKVRLTDGTVIYLYKTYDIATSIELESPGNIGIRGLINGQH